MEWISRRMVERREGGRNRASGGKETNRTLTELAPRNIMAEQSTSAAPLTPKPGQADALHIYIGSLFG